MTYLGTTIPQVTVKRLITVLDKAKIQYHFGDEAQIIWIVHITESNIEFFKSLNTLSNVTLGSIIFGLEWHDEDGYINKANLYIEPEPTSEIVS
jgi:hypothetical protein